MGITFNADDTLEKVDQIIEEELKHINTLSEKLENLK